MTLYGYARVSVREPEDKNLGLQVERLVRAGCAMGNIRAEEASGAKDDRGGLLELLDLVVEGDTLVVTHIDRLSRGLTHGLQVIEGLHHAGVEFRSLSEDFDTSTATGKLQLAMVLAFSEWWRNSICLLPRWDVMLMYRGIMPVPVFPLTRISMPYSGRLTNSRAVSRPWLASAFRNGMPIQVVSQTKATMESMFVGS